MVPRPTNPRTFFHGTFLYYCHDKKARAANRVAWIQTLNLITDSAKKSAKVMAYTAKVASELNRAAGKKRAGTKVAKPVVAYSLSWHPEQSPEKQTVLEAARTSIKKLGPEEHEVIIVAHQDTQHPHIHIIVNHIYPLTGMAANLYKSKRKL